MAVDSTAGLCACISESFRECIIVLRFGVGMLRYNRGSLRGTPGLYLVGQSVGVRQLMMVRTGFF